MSAWLKKGAWANRKECTAKQELLQLDSCSKQEPDVKSLWHDLRMMASHIRSTVLFCNTTSTILVRQSQVTRIPRDRTTSCTTLESCGFKVTIIFPGQDTDSPHIGPTIDFRAPSTCEQYTSHVTFFSCLCALVMLCHTTLAQVFVRVISSMCHAPECLTSLRPSLRTLYLSLPSSSSSS